MFGGGDGISAWGIHDDDATFGGGIDIDIIDSDACASDDFEMGSGVNDLGGGFGFAADDEAVKFADDGEEFIGFEAEIDGDIEKFTVAKLINTALGDGIGDKDFRFWHKISKNEVAVSAVGRKEQRKTE